MASIRPLLRASSLQLLHPQTLYRTARFHAISAHYMRQTPTFSNGIGFLPRFLQPSTYVPSYGKRSTNKKDVKGTPLATRKPWNTATFFIWIFLMIGSQAIQQLSLKQEHTEFMHNANARIDVLRDVVERLGKGEDIDVERMLGTGDDKEERTWEDVLKEIEEDDILWQAREIQKESAAKQAAKQEQALNAIAGQEGQDDKKEIPREPRRAITAEDYSFR